MNKNKNLNIAARNKKDEFYTQLRDIENELRYYRNHFAGKTVFCNCDDPFESQFFFYFAVNFNFLKLKRLIVTSYRGSPVQGNLFNPVNDDRKPVYKVEINRIDKYPFDFDDVAEMLNELKAALDENFSATINGNTLALLDGDGDFRSKECVALLKQADVVVTNPPFSLFREYVKKLIDFDKKFLIVGNMNAVTYKEIFPLIMQNKIWLGYGFRGMVGFFRSPYEDVAVSSQHRDGMIRNSGVHWYTNIETPKRFWDIPLYKKYSPEEYPKYDNYDAIEVSKTAFIPVDYFGVMGVPITFLDKYNPNQFEILGITDRQNTSGLRTKKYTATDAPNYNDLNARSVLKIGDDYKTTYARILIRRRTNND